MVEVGKDVNKYLSSARVVVSIFFLGTRTHKDLLLQDLVLKVVPEITALSL